MSSDPAFRQSSITYYTHGTGQWHTAESWLPADMEITGNPVVSLYVSSTADDGAPLVPGEVTEITFDLLAASAVIEAGHQIRVAIAGVAPEATLVGLKACTQVGYCFADSVAAALRYAGDVGLDVVNLSLFADPYLYYCKSEAQQRAILMDLEAAARYAQRRGVLIVAVAAASQAD